MERADLVAGEESGLRVAFLMARVGPGVLGRHEVKDRQRGLRLLSALITTPHKESVTGIHAHRAICHVVLVGESADHERNGSCGQSQSFRSILRKSCLSMSTHQLSCQKPSLHLPHRLFSSCFRARGSFVDLFEASARCPLLLPESHP